MRNDLPLYVVVLTGSNIRVPLIRTLIRTHSRGIRRRHQHDVAEQPG
jgi:hypothetical protein